MNNSLNLMEFLLVDMQYNVQHTWINRNAELEPAGLSNPIEPGCRRVIQLLLLFVEDINLIQKKAHFFATAVRQHQLRLYIYTWIIDYHVNNIHL